MVIEILKRKMEITRDSRFAASRRVYIRSKLGVAQISLLTLFIVIISIAQLAYAKTINESQNLSLTILTIVASLLILIISMLEALGSYELKSHRLHQSGIAVAGILTEYEIEGINGIEASDKYNRAIAENDVNHWPIDILYVMKEKPWLFKIEGRGKFYINAKYHVLVSLRFAGVFLPSIIIASMFFAYIRYNSDIVKLAQLGGF